MEGESAGSWQPGWYEYPHGGGQRYWDGERWTDHFAPPATTHSTTHAFVRTVLGVWAGFLLGWATIWLGSQVTDEISWPIKTVVDRGEVDSVDEALEQLEFNDSPAIPEP
jgi:hypothetical protein